MKITTNNQPRYMTSFLDLPKKAQADFDYVEEADQCSERFVCYRGVWYDVFNMMRVADDQELKDWDAYHSDSYFSGVVVKLVDGDEQVIMGSYCA